MTFLIGFVAILFVFLFIVLELKKQWLYAIFVKGAASFLFVFTALVAIAERTMSEVTFPDDAAMKISLLFVGGLVAGLLGDVALALRPLRPTGENKTIIASGIACFSIGHVFYLAALLLFGGFQWEALPFALVVTALVYGMSRLMKFQMGWLTAPTFFYSFLIFWMVGQAIFVRIDAGVMTFLNLAVAGAMLFGISDLILAPIYYKGVTRPALIGANLVTYYAAQILLAISLLFL